MRPLRAVRGCHIFFPLAGLEALAWLPLWTGYHSGAIRIESHLVGAVWHGHEMLFGYLAAVLAGFLTLGDAGRHLIGLALLWLLARILLVAPGPVPPAAVIALDAAFLPLLLILRRPGLWSGRKFMLLGIGAVILGLSAVNLWIHIATLSGGDPNEPLLIATDFVILLLVIAGGRLIPGHTRAATRRGVGLTLTGAERAGIGLVIALVVCDLFAWPTGAGACAGLLGLSQAYRLARWWDRRILSDPLLWSLHLGFAWLVAGLGLRALADLTGWIDRVAALHAILIGAVGTLTLSIMTRQSFGRTLRPADVGAAVIGMAALVGTATALRVTMSPAPSLGRYGMVLAAALWSGAYALFLAHYGPFLATVFATRRPPDLAG